MLWLTILSRWVHIGSAITMVGGSVFLRLVLMPAAQALPEADHNTLRLRIMSRWKKVVHSCVLLFLLSGFYNFIVVTMPLHKGDKMYHALIGIKILLALVVFFFAIALTSSKSWSEGLRRKSGQWLAVNLMLATVIVAISGVLKNMPATSGPKAAAAVQPEKPAE
ncbi:MAG TPA: hypothetical protein VHB77_18910 [Planctomycetaceae bacterium]|nr:hypothetical protein [Planctomycetaceae bacterium]